MVDSRFQQETAGEMNRAEIVEAIRAYAAKHGVVWLTEHGAIVLAPNGEVACVRGAGRDYFTKDCPLGFITGMAALLRRWAKFLMNFRHQSFRWL
jgi:hypothetical protein